MLAAAPSAAVLGIDALDVLVEVHVANGLPQWTIVSVRDPHEHGAHEAKPPSCGGPIAQTAIPALGRSRTHLATRRGLVDVAFVIDVLSRRIVEPPRVFTKRVRSPANQSQLASVVAGFAVSISGRI